MTTEIPRDRWKHPLIIPLDDQGQPDLAAKPVPYARPSSMAKALDDQYNLMLWKQRKTAEGLLIRPDLMTQVAGAVAKGDPDTNNATKKLLNSITAQAIEAAGASKGSSAGTGFHHLTEAIDGGSEPRYVPAQDRERLEAYKEATAGVRWLDIECFVVNDLLLAAGTFDRLGVLPDGRIVVMDLKSGKSEAAFPLSTDIQIAIYANAKRYNPETGERTPLHEDLDLSTGILIHLPPWGGCETYTLDLERGWKAAKIAAEVYRDIRKWKAAELAQPIFLGEGATMTQDTETPRGVEE